MGAVVPRLCHFKFREARPEYPLAEEPIEALSRRILERKAELISLCGGKLVFCQVVVNAAPEGLIAQKTAQHVEHPGPPGVQVCRVAVVTHDRLSSLHPVVAPHGRRRLHHLVLEFIPPFREFHPEGLTVCRKSFIQPEVRPVTCSHDIPEPHVGKLVRNHRVGGKIECRS